MTTVADGITTLTSLRGFAVVQSPDRGAGLAGAMDVARGLVPPEFRDADIAVLSPDGARWALPDLAGQLKYQQGYIPAGDQRVIILDRADQMDVRAAENLLLRVEEPVSEVVYLAVVRDGQSLLPTLRSRSIVTIDAPPRDPGELSRAAGMGLSPRMVGLLTLCPLTEASLPDTAQVAVPLLQELLDEPLSDPTAAGFRISSLIRSAARAVSQKGPNDPLTRAVQRELAAGWVELVYQDAVQALRADPGAAAVARCLRIEKAQEMLPLHLPLEHVVGYVCLPEVSE